MPASNPAPIDLFGTFLSSLSEPSQEQLTGLWKYCSEFKRQENPDQAALDLFIAGMKNILDSKKIL